MSDNRETDRIPYSPLRWVRQWDFDSAGWFYESIRDVAGVRQVFQVYRVGPSNPWLYQVAVNGDPMAYGRGPGRPAALRSAQWHADHLLELALESPLDKLRRFVAPGSELMARAAMADVRRRAVPES